MLNNTRIGRSACLFIAFAVLSACQLKNEEEQLRNAAERGDAEAQHGMGVRYYLGHGVPMDQREAVKWWRRSAAQGHAAAQRSLGELYGVGEGVTQDFVKAYAWFHLAALQGDERGVEYKGRYAKEMTPEQVAEAEKLASRLQEQIDAGQLRAEVEDTNCEETRPSVSKGKALVTTRSTQGVAAFSGEYFVMGFRGDRSLDARAMRLTFNQATGAVIGQWDVKYKSINPENTDLRYPVGSGEISGDFDAVSGTLRLQLGGTIVFHGEMRPPDNLVKEKVFRGRLSGGAKSQADSLLLIQKLAGSFKK